jgi:hypothetical protein
MSNLNIVPNPSATPTPAKKRGGPKGKRTIKTLEQVQANANLAAIAQEMTKIDNKLVRLEKAKKVAHQQTIDAQASIVALLEIRATFLASTGVKI